MQTARKRHIWPSCKSKYIIEASPFTFDLIWVRFGIKSYIFRINPNRRIFSLSAFVVAGHEPSPRIYSLCAAAIICARDQHKIDRKAKVKVFCFPTSRMIFWELFGLVIWHMWFRAATSALRIKLVQNLIYKMDWRRHCGLSLSFFVIGVKEVRYIC